MDSRLEMVKADCSKSGDLQCTLMDRMPPPESELLPHPFCVEAQVLLIYPVRMGKPGPFDGWFANGVRFVCGAMLGVIVAVRLLFNRYSFSSSGPSILRAFIFSGIMLACGLAAARFRDDFWESLFDALFWWRR